MARHRLGPATRRGHGGFGPRAVRLIRRQPTVGLVVLDRGHAIQHHRRMNKRPSAKPTAGREADSHPLGASRIWPKVLRADGDLKDRNAITGHRLGQTPRLLPPMDAEVLPVAEWRTPATAYPCARRGVAEVAFHTYTRGIYDCYGMNGYKYFEVRRPIRICNLKVRRRVWMVDDPPHWFAMLNHASRFHGHVVCAGLGLGLIVHALAANPKVTAITVVEREADVIALVKPLLPECEVVHANFWDWTGQPDGILYDLFVGSGREIRDEALGVYINLRRHFPQAQVRIHGFNNEAMETYFQAIQRSVPSVPTRPRTRVNSHRLQR
jgi:hypothetical protein